MLERYSWPGNVRELQSVLKQAMLRSTGTVLLPDFLPSELRQSGEGGSAEGGRQSLSMEAFVDERLSAGTRSLYQDYQAFTERVLLERVMASTKGDVREAAEILGMPIGRLKEALGRVTAAHVEQSSD